MAVLPPDPIFSLRSSEMGPVYSICFHKNERLLAGTLKGTVHLWDLQTNRSSLYFEAGTNPITSVYHSEDYLISQEKGGLVKCWSLKNSGYELKWTHDFHYSAFCHMDILDEGSTTNTSLLAAIPQEDNEISLVSLENCEIQQTLIPPASSPASKLGSILSLKAINIKGQFYILAGYESGDVLTWDIRSSSKVINQINFGGDGDDKAPIMCIDYDSNTNRGICAGTSDKITVFSYQGLRKVEGEGDSIELIKKSEISIRNAGVNCVKIRRDQKIFASGGWDGRIRLFSWKSLRPLAVLTEHKNGGIMDICFSTDKVASWKASLMAAAGMDGQITLWDLYN